jgi:hypothetical protein
VKQRKYDFEKLKNTDIVKEYKQEVRNSLVESNKQQIYQSEGKSEV